MGSRLEIPIAEAQAHATPNVGAATGHAQAAHPVKRFVCRRGVWFFEIVDEPVVGIFVANSEFDLDGPRLADEFRGLVPIFELKFWLLLREILIGLRTAAFQERTFAAPFRHPFASPPARHAPTATH